MSTQGRNVDIYQSKVKLFTINTRMIPSKLVYLLSLGCSGSYVPYLNIFFRSIGLTTTQAGYISGIRFLSAPISTPLFGSLADSTGHRQLIFLVLCLGAYIPIFCMPWVARALRTVSSNATLMQYNVTMANGTALHENTPSDSKCLFYTMLTVMIIAGFFSVPLAGFIDSVVMNVIKTGKQKTNFGAQRMVGSISFGLANFLAGVAADNYQHPTLSNYTAIFYVFLPQMILLLPVGHLLLTQCKWKDTTQSERCEPVGKLMYHFFARFDSLIFLITVLVSGVAYNIFYGFLFLFMRDEMDASSKLMTVVIVTTSVAEILTFPFTSKIIRYIGSTHLAIIIGIFSYFIRFMYMSYVTQAWMLVPIQITHGVGFSLSWAAQVEYTHKISPKEISVTMFSIVTSIHFALGAIIGNVLGGKVYDIIGGRILFRANGMLCGVWSCLLLTYYIWTNYKFKKGICGIERIYEPSVSTQNNEITLLATTLIKATPRR